MNEGSLNVGDRDSETRKAVTLLFCAILAAGLHAGVLYAWKYQPKEAGLIQVLGDSVEVALVEAANASLEPAPEETPATSVSQSEPLRPELLQTPPPAESRAPEPVPIPVSEAPAPEPLPLSKEESPAPPSRETPPPAPKPKPPVTAARPPQSGKPSEGIPVKGSTTGTVGNVSGKVLGKPLYLVRPQVNYPSESRAAGEQGVVLLRITVNASGRPTSVTVANSSGFSRLDRAAVEGGWRCRVSNAFEGAQFEAPLRFGLLDR